MDENIKLAIPYYKQDTDYTCGPASLQMAMAFLGEFRSEDDLAEKAEADPKNGTRNRKMIEVAQKEGFYVYVNDNSSIDELAYLLHEGLPVIVNFREPVRDEGHFAVVKGLSRGEIILNDPYNGGDFRMPIPEFLERWVNSDGRHPRWLMSISKSEIGFGREYHPQ